MAKLETIGYCKVCYSLRLTSGKETESSKKRKGIWLDRIENPKVYDLLIENYERLEQQKKGGLSHTWCSKDCSKKSLYAEDDN